MNLQAKLNHRSSRQLWSGVWRSLGVREFKVPPLLPEPYRVFLSQSEWSGWVRYKSREVGNVSIPCEISKKKWFRRYGFLFILVGSWVYLYLQAYIFYFLGNRMEDNDETILNKSWTRPALFLNVKIYEWKVMQIRLAVRCSIYVYVIYIILKLG